MFLVIPLIWHPTCCWVSSIITFYCVLLQCLSIWTGYQLPQGRCSALKIIDANLACDSRQPGCNQEEQSRQMPGMPFSCENLDQVFTKVYVIKYFLPSSVSFLLALFLPDIILFYSQALNAQVCFLSCKPLWKRSTVQST